MVERVVTRTVVQQVEVPVPKPEEHPVLGEARSAPTRPNQHTLTPMQLLYDFGYKRVYATRATVLADPATISTWHQQRAFRPERAEAIARAKSRDASLGLPGVVTLYELPGGRFRAIVDGQHRVGALRRLLLPEAGQEGPWSRVLVEVYSLPDEAHAERLFTEINSAQPVLPLDLPPSAGGAAVPHKAVLDAAVAALAAQYPAMFKASHSCKPPHLNVDALRDRLFQLDILAAHDLTTPDALLAWLASRNAALAGLTPEAWDLRRPARKSAASDATFAKALAKAREHGFFLGVDSRWLEE